MLLAVSCVFAANQIDSSFQAGAMDRAAKLPKIQDEEKESKYGYVHAVSGPGM